MIPTLGRIVHYTGLGGGVDVPAEQQAAIITGVKKREEFLGAWEERESIVDLHIFYRTGQVDLMDVPYNPEYRPGHWSWPPKV